MNGIKKNILDLHFQKHLIIASTSILVTFTYFVGMGIAIITEQIKFDNLLIILLLSVISLIILSISTSLFFNSFSHIKNIPKVLKKLEE